MNRLPCSRQRAGDRRESLRNRQTGERMRKGIPRPRGRDSCRHLRGTLIDHISEHERNAYITCTQVSRKKIYASKPVLDIELSGYKIMATLMEVFIDAAVNPSRFYSKQLLRRVSSQYDIWLESLEERIMAVLDYISGMTDIYALDIYQKINGISLPIV